MNSGIMEVIIRIIIKEDLEFSGIKDLIDNRVYEFLGP